MNLLRLSITSLALVTSVFADNDRRGELLARDDFEKDLSQWVVEQTPHGTTR